MILALDPSSTAIGYALFDARPRCVEMGVLKPDTPKEPDPTRRAYQMAAIVRTILDEHADDIALVLIETPPPTQGQRRSNPAAQHQAYGVVMGVLHDCKLPRIVPINPATWTGNSRKEVRAAYIRERHRIPPDKDKGNDACDAIGLAEWWIEIGQHRHREGADG